LFDLIDNSLTGEVDGVVLEDYGKVADVCTLCDMCFMTKCPYVPPHEFQSGLSASDAALARGRAEGRAGFAVPTRIGRDRPQWAFGRGRGAARQLGHRSRQPADSAGYREDIGDQPARGFAEVSWAHVCDARQQGRAGSRSHRTRRGAQGVLYATCFVNYNNPSIGEATRAVLARNGVETEVVYPRCCGMPQFGTGRSGGSRGLGGKGFGGSRALGRQGLRHRSAGSVLCADAQIRVAADPA
jgi:glycerol-3-phosphate dehydrogenase subunit C